MTLELFSTKDTVVGAFMAPFVLHNKEEAKRSWGTAINQEKNNIATNDLQLWSLGTLDDETGEITPKIEYVSKAQDFIKKEIENNGILQREQQTKDDTTTNN